MTIGLITTGRLTQRLVSIKQFYNTKDTLSGRKMAFCVRVKIIVVCNGFQIL